MFLLLKPILLRFINSKAAKEFIVESLRTLSKQTDNQVDDVAVAYIERLLLQNQSLDKPTELGFSWTECRFFATGRFAHCAMAEVLSPRFQWNSSTLPLLT